MAASACAKCGGVVPSTEGRGRPRKFCLGCAPRRQSAREYAPRPRVTKVCEHCGAKFESVNSSRVRYCSSDCRSMVAQRRDCSKCGIAVWWNPATSAEDPTCRQCRAPGHGTVARYRSRGCRCADCRAAIGLDNRRYREKRAAEGRPVVKQRARRDCDFCGAGFLARLDYPQRLCSVECAKREQGFTGVPRIANRFRISPTVRREIYEAAGWKCTLCDSPVRPDADTNHPRYPTLDHIEPRALGGSDDRDNLRLSCRQCNTLRGTNVDWAPSEAVA